MMANKSIINQMEIAYAPLTNYEFAVVKDDPDIERALDNSSLYIIAQRPIISFEKLVPCTHEYAIEFEIHQRGNPETLKCKLPLAQEVVGSTEADTIGVAFNFFEYTKEITHSSFSNLFGFSLFKEALNEQNFLIWFSPEKLLLNWWRGHIKCEIVGNYREFLRYQVHYVGKATKQSILKRLTGHNTLQDILSLEQPITYKDLPTHEIAILCFRFQNNLEIQSFGANSDIKDMVAAFRGIDRPKQETIFLDAEKALIRSMQPEYNKELFKKYPISKDGLYKNKYDAVSYTFMDPITLCYKEGEIIGGLTPIGGDTILILENKTIELIKSNK